MTSEKEWLKITFPCPERLTEAVADLMGVLSGTGVEIHPVAGKERNDISGFFELAQTPGAEAADVVLQRVTGEMKNLFTLYDMLLPEPELKIIDDQDWSTSWQKYFKPYEIVPGLVIKPSWETFHASANQHVLEMDPGMAFGTGQHESTRLALSLTAACCQNPQNSVDTVLDVGTGTGILAMAAAVFGARKVTAIDNDPEAVIVAATNVQHNSLDAAIQVSTTPLADIQDNFDLICANIVHNVLVEMAPEFQRLLTTGGHIILAGILAGDQETNIISLYGHHGMQVVATRNEGDWTGILLHRTL